VRADSYYIRNGSSLDRVCILLLVFGAAYVSRDLFPDIVFSYYHVHSGIYRLLFDMIYTTPA
jgi:hypothetical protein